MKNEAIHRTLFPIAGSWVIAASLQFLGAGPAGRYGLQASPQGPVFDAGTGPAARLGEAAGPVFEPPIKLQRWSGNLVDAACMSSVLREVPPVDKFVYPSPPLPLPGSTDDGPRAAPAKAAAPATYPLGGPPSPAQPESPGINENDPELSKRELELQAADLKRAKVLEHAVKTCMPKTPTAHFGLLVSGERLLKFDPLGDLKAMQAIKTTLHQPGKMVKARVTGAMEAGDTVRVASIEIKNRIPNPEVLSKARTVE